MENHDSGIVGEDFEISEDIGTLAKEAELDLIPKESMEKCKSNHDMGIGTYPKLRQFLKNKSVGYRPNKSAVFSTEAIRRFLNDTTDEQFLDVKVNF